VTVQFTDGN